MDGFNIVDNFATSIMNTFPTGIAFVDNIYGPNSFDLSKPFRFDSTNFKRWQHKMEFFLTIRKFVQVLKTDVLVVSEQAEKEERDQNENDNFCKNFILNEFSYDLYDYDSPYKSAKLVLYALEKKYDTETKRYVVSRYLDHFYDTEETT
ncbi:hypothetical protein Lal_00017021 [Lupinus albus]|nr:hypothetical protein Lal_00017021 [Lupinus albus]